MPTIPTVFRSLRTNDVQHRPFKVYKNYKINQSSYSDLGVRLQKAFHFTFPQTIGDFSTSYESNSVFNDTNNMHVMWNSLDHKYYRYPFDPARTLELSNISKTEKFLFTSASILTIPYLDVGEKIKKDSVIIDSTVQNFQNLDDYTISLYDDNYGNLRDQHIDSASFANKNQLQFYLSFNNAYRKFQNNFGYISTGSISYKISADNINAKVQNVNIVTGVSTHAGGSDYVPSGISGKFTSGSLSYVRIDDHEVFTKFNKCDQWAISTWVKPEETTTAGVILTKGGRKKEQYYDPADSLIKERIVDVIRPTPISGIADFSKYKTPFHLSLYNEEVHFQSSDGSHQLHISASAAYRDGWMHILVQNSASLCKLYINGNESGTNGPIPKLNTSNTSYMFLGSNGDHVDHINTTMGNFGGDIAEVRMYDYILSDASKLSLANQNFYSGSLYQTSVAGNVFYRNGQIAISSPLRKYDNIFVSSSNTEAGTFEVRYRGTHTIYENEVMVRVPRGACNVSVNPSATYRPSAGLDNNCVNGESKNGPGEFRKTMFLSGSAFPYVTTIGLYNDKCQLLAVGKLAEPIQKRNDIDMNFVVRWDY